VAVARVGSADERPRNARARAPYVARSGAGYAKAIEKIRTTSSPDGAANWRAPADRNGANDGIRTRAE
jgi:hypothetical protein